MEAVLGWLLIIVSLVALISAGVSWLRRRS